MKIIDRYLLKHFLLPFFFCLVTFVLLYAVIDLFDKLNEMLENNVDLLVLVPYYLNFIPIIVVQTSPIAVLVSIMYSLGTFNRHNEITAMRASGISLLRILSPLIVGGVLISVAVFVINDNIVPGSTMNISDIRQDKIEKAKIEKKRKKGEKLIENIVFYGIDNKIIYARRYFVYKKVLEGVIIHAQDKYHNVISKTTATEAQWKDGRWLGKNVMFFELDSVGRIKGEPLFSERKYLDIKETPLAFEKMRYQTEFMSFAKLREYIERLSFEGGATIRNLKVDLNQKVALPFANLIVVLVASPFALAHTKRGGVLVGIGISVALVFSYYAVMSISLALGKAGFIVPALAAWMPNVIFAALGIILILKYK